MNRTVKNKSPVMQRFQKTLLLLALAGAGLLPGLSRAATDDHALRLSLAMDFGGRASHSNAMDLALRYGPGHPEAGGFHPPALFDARRAAGQWQSLKLSGVDVLGLRQRLQAQGEDEHYAGWIIGGLVGVGLVAIVVREINNDDQKSFDINGRDGDNR